MAATSAFPSSEAYGLTSQLRRAAVSIPSNLAEGHTRDHTREYLQSVSVAQGSLAEVETQLELARRLKFIDEERTAELLLDIVALGKQLYRLRDALAKSLLAPGPRPLAPAP